MRVIVYAIIGVFHFSSANGNDESLTIWEQQLELLRQVRSEGEVREFDPERPGTVLSSFVKHELTASPSRIVEVPPLLVPMALEFGETEIHQKQYLDILVAICDLVGKGMISPKDGLVVMDSSQDYGPEWLIVHYRYPPLAKALRSMIPRYAGMPEDKLKFEEILSGKAYKDYWWYRHEFGNPPFEPVVGPPPPHPGYWLLAKVVAAVLGLAALDGILWKRLRNRRKIRFSE
jgi:hypothetical protein